MYLDKQLILSDSQVVTANGNSTDYYDAGVSKNLGGGEPLIPIVHVVAKSGTAPTLQVKLVGADDSAFSTNKITLFDTGTIADPVALGRVRMALPSHHDAPKRYYRYEYVVGGTSPSFTIIAGFTDHEQALNTPIA